VRLHFRQCSRGKHDSDSLLWQTTVGSLIQQTLSDSLLLSSSVTIVVFWWGCFAPAALGGNSAAPLSLPHCWNQLLSDNLVAYQSISFHTPFISPSPIDSFRPFLDLSLSAYNAHFHKPFLLYRTDYLPFQGPISRRLPSVVLLFQRNISVQLYFWKIVAISVRLSDNWN